MGKRKKKNDNMQQQKPKEPIALPVDAGAGFSAEEWQHIIANAMVEAEEIKAEKEQEKQSERQNQKMGIKDFFHILFIPKKEVKNAPASFAMLKTVLYMVWCSAQYLLYFLAVIFLLCMPAHYFIETAAKMHWSYHILYTILAIVSFVYAQCCRIARIETENIQDKEKFYAIFGAIAALASTIMAIISLFK